MTVIWIASLLALASAGLCFGVLRKLTRPVVSSEDPDDGTGIACQGGIPLERLLDPSEFEFLRKSGLSRQRIQQLRAKRRSLFRMYMRRLTHEFNMVHRVLQSAVVSAQADRPDLVTELGRQRILFYRALIGVEMRLTLNALGFVTVHIPSVDLLRPLQCLHQEFCRMVPDLQGAPA